MERSPPKLRRAQVGGCIAGSECPWRPSRRTPPRGAAQDGEGKPGRLDEQRAAVRRHDGRRCWRAQSAPSQPTLSQSAAEHRRRQEQARPFTDGACDGGCLPSHIGRHERERRLGQKADGHSKKPESSVCMTSATKQGAIPGTAGLSTAEGFVTSVCVAAETSMTRISGSV